MHKDLYLKGIVIPKLSLAWQELKDGRGSSRLGAHSFVIDDGRPDLVSFAEFARLHFITCL